MPDKAIRRILNFNFSGEDAHVALVDEGANLQKVLVMKAKASSPPAVSKAKKPTTKTTPTKKVATVPETIDKIDIQKMIKTELAKQKADMQKDFDKEKEILLEKVSLAETAKYAELTKAMTRKATNYVEFGVEDVVEFAKAMVKVNETAEGVMILTALEKAAERLVDTLDFAEFGASINQGDAEITGLAKAIKSQNPQPKQKETH